MGGKSAKQVLFDVTKTKPDFGEVNPKNKNFLNDPHEVFNERNLYIITCVFNPAGFTTRPKLYNEFKERLSQFQDVVLITVECAFDENPFQVTKPYNEPFDIQIRGESKIWLKENLLNIGISKLPPQCKHIMWVDSDIEFCDPNWVHKVRFALKTHPVAQIFKSAEYLGPDKEILRIDKSFSFYYCTQQEISRKQSLTHYRHPGYGWCATREFLKAVGGLFDMAILGNGDKHMAYSFIGKCEDSIPPNFTMAPGFMEELNAYQNRAVIAGSKNLGFINMSIRHHYHGDRQDRQYMHRWFLLQNFMYDPKTDLAKNSYGAYILVSKPQFSAAILEYFQNRNEDSKVTKESLVDYVELNKKMSRRLKDIEKEERKKAKDLLKAEKVKYNEGKTKIKKDQREKLKIKVNTTYSELALLQSHHHHHEIKKKKSFGNEGDIGY